MTSDSRAYKKLDKIQETVADAKLRLQTIQDSIVGATSELKNLDIRSELLQGQVQDIERVRAELVKDLGVVSDIITDGAAPRKWASRALDILSGVVANAVWAGVLVIGGFWLGRYRRREQHSADT